MPGCRRDAPSAAPWRRGEIPTIQNPTAKKEHGDVRRLGCRRDAPPKDGQAPSRDGAIAPLSPYSLITTLPYSHTPSLPYSWFKVTGLNLMSFLSLMRPFSPRFDFDPTNTRSIPNDHMRHKRHRKGSPAIRVHERRLAFKTGSNA